MDIVSGVAERMIDLVIEGQRRPGDAQHQEEQRADEARPLVDEVHTYE
jgi:hypothetical protein